MSDSAEGDASRPGATPTASAELAADSGLKPDEADRFASAFVPAWQFEEAPFSAAAQLSKSEIEELAATAGAQGNSTIVDHGAPPFAREVPGSAKTELSSPAGSGATKLEPFATDSATTDTDSLPPVFPQPDVPITPAPAPAVGTVPLPAAPSPPRILQANENANANQSIPALSPSPTLDDSDFSPRRTNKGTLIAVGGGVAVLVIVAGVLLTRGGESPAAATTATAPTTAAPPTPPPLPRANEESRIPPPPAVAEPSPPPATPAPPRSAAPPPIPTPPPATPTHPSSTVPSRAPEATHAPRNLPPVLKGSTKANGGGIVRDNPF
jgi:hypothetical protein